MTQHTLQITLADMNQRWDAAFNRGDAAALAALYDEHAAVLPAGGDAALGTRQIEALFAGAIGQGIRNHRIELHAVEGDERVATQRGRWSAEATTADGGVQHFGGHLTLAYRRQPDGSWRALTHIWN
jgi:ketosteroid isomerase-like protein